jgi:hypothetical protein
MLKKIMDENLEKVTIQPSPRMKDKNHNKTRLKEIIKKRWRNQNTKIMIRETKAN